MMQENGIGVLSIVIAGGAILAMLAGIWFVFERMRAKEQGIGPNGLKALGVVLFIPSILLMAVHGRFESEALAALLGTIAGYVLSHSKEDSS